MGEFLFELKKLVTALVLPPTGPLVLAALGLLVMARRPRLGRALAWIGVLVLLALSLPVVSYALMHGLETAPALAPGDAAGAQAIVVIGGGVRRNAVEYGGDTVNGLTLDRVRYGAMLARRTGLPVLVSGGPSLGSLPEGELMRRTLEDEFGVPVKWTEARARNTHENAQFSAAILKGADVRRILLVTHGVDMRRAGDEFRAAGLEVVPAPTGLPRAPGSHYRDWIPGFGALAGSYYALYEWLANAARALRLN